MGFKGSFQGKAVLTALVLGTFAFSLPSAADARLLHDPQVETKVEMHQGIEQGRTKETKVQAAHAQQPLSERIKDILNPPAPEKKPVERAPGVLVTAPFPFRRKRSSRIITRKAHARVCGPMWRLRRR